jgi:Putative zinc ribbon domain
LILARREMMNVEMEQHVCQSCGMPMNPEDYAEGSEKGDYCSFCMVHGEFTAGKEEVKAKVTGKILETSGKTRQEAEAAAEETMKGLKRWQ